MPGLRRTLDELRRYHDKLKAAFAKEAGGRRGKFGCEANRLREVTAFGSNPGRLRMWSYVPQSLAPHAPLVVVLHGCTQTACGFDYATGWSTLADRCGFAVLFPEQTQENNPNLCFNWFDPSHTARGRGEAASIEQMVACMLGKHGLDPARTGITGLSAGGAMAAVMLATYPDVFAAGAIIAGLPYGCAANVQQAFECMMQGRSRPAADWAGLVRNASPNARRWPRVSIWHGDADKTVLPINAEELAKQWPGIHPISGRPTIKGKLAGFPYRAWQGETGEILVESITVPGMGHCAPIAAGLGHAAPFVVDVGISSTYHIARSWGLVAPTAAGAWTEQEAAMREDLASPSATAAEHGGARPDLGWSLAPDPSAVIQSALRAAGLLK